MGMLFGGWAKSEEEIVQEEHKGDWNKYKEAQQYLLQQEIENSKLNNKKEEEI